MIEPTALGMWCMLYPQQVICACPDLPIDKGSLLSSYNLI